MSKRTAILCTAIAVSLIGANGLAEPPTANVNVTNTPLPVTGSVTGTVTGSVDAEVTNDAANPIPAVTQPRREGFDEANPVVSTSFTMDFIAMMEVGDLSATEPDTYVVPDGKRLVIEYASFNPAGTPTPPDPGATYTAYLQILSAVYVRVAIHVLGTVAPRVSSTGGGIDIDTSWEGGNMVRIYAGPGETITVSAGRNWDTDSFAVVTTLSGYLENAN